jgi:hypothetical protein
VESFTVVVLLPLFFITVGLSIDLGELQTTGAGIDLLWIVLVASGGKLVGSTLPALLCGCGVRRSLAIGVLMNTRGLTEIVVLQIARQTAIIDASLFTMLVAMAVITTAVAGPLLSLIYPPSALLAERKAELKEFVEGLAKRAEALKRGRIDPREDNMLKITTEGRKAALDLRLMKPSLPDDPQSKVNLAVEKIQQIWEATKDDRLAQLVFCDLSTPQDRGFSVYRDMADKLKRLGVPENEIAFIQDYDADNAKLGLFRSVRAGKVRVLFGSTQKMGSGTNVQERLIALHHLDAPWRPADVEQREGRILRQGNKNALVQIFRYVTEGSFDAYMWQALETKARFIGQVITGDNAARRAEDIGSQELSYAEVKAIASGNPAVLTLAEADADSRLRAGAGIFAFQGTWTNVRGRCEHGPDQLGLAGVTDVHAPLGDGAGIMLDRSLGGLIRAA